MTKPQLFTAEYNGKTYNLSIKAFSKLMDRSTSFVHARIDLAKVQHHDNPMQFAIEESERCVKRSDYKPQEKRISTTPGRKTTIQEKFAADNRHLINGFLLPRNVELQEKREFV